MADGGQRLLDVIDDPNALESFLGGLTADSELLPSGETVDNVVASLARSLGENEYEVDSPNETLFDTLDSSSNHLTDISRSYVPSDFGHVAVQNDSFTSNLDGFSNGNVIRGNLSQHEQQTTVGNSGCDQFIGSSSNNTINSVISASTISNSTNVTASNLKQISASVSNCDPAKSVSNYVQAGQIHLNSVSSPSNNLNFTFSQDLQQKHNITVSQNQLNQVTSLSSVSVEGQIQQNIPSNSTNNLISVVGSGNENGVINTLTDSSSNFHLVSNQQSGQIKAQNLPPDSSQNTRATIQVSSGSSSVSNTSVNNAASASNATASNITLSNNVGSGASTLTIQQAPQQQFITNTSSHQNAVNQIVSGQTVSIPSMTVSAPQLINSQGGLIAATGQNIIQQIQSAGGSQSYIAMEQPTALIATGHSPFGTANVALVHTAGGTPTYAVLPSTQQFLTNAIIPQQHTIQTLTKTSNGTYYQTTGTPQIVATSNVNALQNVSVANPSSDTISSTIVKPKQPPQLLPKPLSQVNTTVTTSIASTGQTPSVISVSSSSESSSGARPSSNSSADGVMTQIIQSPQQLTNVGGNTGAVAITPQQSYTISNTAGMGQVVVSQVNSLNTMTAPQQTQLAGTIVVNQYGQPMLVPNASTAHTGGLQLILRQAQTQPQVLTIQAPAGAAAQAASGKPIVRYVSQMPQLAQTSGYGFQQIQTANGQTHWVAVRYPSNQTNQFSQIQTESIVNQPATIQSQIAGGQSIQIQTQQSQQVQLQVQQQQGQVIQQSQQQIQLQGGVTQAQMQQVQVQGAQHLQLQQQQQQMTLQSQAQSQQVQVHLQNQQGHIANAQQVQQQQLSSLPAQNYQSSHNQGSIPMDTQTNTAQQSQFLSRNQSIPHGNVSSPIQQMRDTEQQQISVPDSSSEPPPPKKAKSKAKSSKKKVTLDLEQLLKQSGIMDEDLNDDMSFDFGFASMDTQPNGLPPSPQLPPAQIPVINTTETPKKSSAKKSKSKAKKPPIITLPPPPPVLLFDASPKPKPPKKKYPKKKKSPPPTPPPPVPTPPPPPPPPVVTPTKSKSKKKASIVVENQKIEFKTASSKKTVPPKKISSLDTLLATIEAVAQAAGASSSKSASTPPPPPPPVVTTPSRKPTPSPKSKGSKSKSKVSVPPSPVPAKIETPPPPPAMVSTTHMVPSPISSVVSHLPPVAVSNYVSHSVNSAPTNLPVQTLAPPVVQSPMPSSVVPSPQVAAPNMTNGGMSVTTSQSGVTRVVQTIQLTPQNQQLLRNIQSQIQKLFAIPKRSETEQSALHKLVTLQQQVIATGIPVPNPAHLNNLAQNVNVESINLTTPCATVPSSDPVTATSTSNPPLAFPYENEVYPNPVSSTVTAPPVLTNAKPKNSSKFTTSKNATSTGSSPAPYSGTTSSAGSSNGACVVGSPSVSSTASPDSTSNLNSSITYEQSSMLPSTSVAHAGNKSTSNINSGGVEHLSVANVKADMGQLIASVSVASSEDKHKENTQAKSSFGVSTSVPASTTSTSSVSYSQLIVPTSTPYMVPTSTPYMTPTFGARPPIDEKKAEEQRLANLKAEEEKRARWKKEEFEMLLQRDQQYVVKPDYEVPFTSQNDAVERLMKYHIYRDRNDMNFEEFDSEFGNNAGILLEKFSVMMSKYRNLLLKESMKEVGCAERVMLERMFVSEEKVRLEQDRLCVGQGDILELPPPPDSWMPKIKEMVDKEMMEFEPLDPVVSQQVQSAVDSIIGCPSEDPSSFLLEDGDRIEYDAFGVPINSSGYAGLTSASSADIDEAVRSILT